MSLSQALATKDLVDFLLRNSMYVSRLSLEEKVALKALRPKPNLHLKTQDDDGREMCFKAEWYEKCEWLTGSSIREKIYCFYCVLFSYRNIGEWSKTGLGAECLKNMNKRIKSHESSTHHIYAAIRFKGMGKTLPNRSLPEAERLAAIKHNEQVDHNRLIMKRLISAASFLARQGLPVGGTSTASYLDLLDLLAEEEPHIKNHLINCSTFHVQEASMKMQNELVKCITDVMKEQVVKEVENSHFVSVQLDSTTDGTENKVSIIIRYANLSTGNVDERFLGFYPLQNNTPDGLVELVFSVLKTYHVTARKLIAVSYDGTISTLGESPSSVFNLIKTHCPHATLTHSNNQQLNMVLIHACKTIKAVKSFIANLTAFEDFFCRSNRMKILGGMHNLPQSSEIQWHVEHVLTFTCSILTHYNDLKAALQEVLDKDGWDCESMILAKGLRESLEDPEFVFLLFLFSKLYKATTALHEVPPETYLDVKKLNEDYQKCLSSVRSLRGPETARECIEKAKELMAAVDTVSEVKIEVKTEEMLVEYEEHGRNSSLDSKFDQHTFFVLSFKIVNNVIENLMCRFEGISAMSPLDMINETKFKTFHSDIQVSLANFPKALLRQLLVFYPFFDELKLRGELFFIYGCEDKHLPPKALFESLVVNDLKDVLPEIVKLLSMILCIPVMTACDKDRNILRRIETSARQKMTDDKLMGLATLAIEKEFVKTCCSKQEFISRVIDLYASIGGRIELIYKQI